MYWLNEINEFPKFDILEINSDIGKKDAAKVNNKYSKALKNAQSNSVDIAIIELRKLAVLYPESGQISMLLGCCRMLDHKPEEALTSFRKAQDSSMPLDLEPKLEKYIEEAKKEVTRLSSQEHREKHKKTPIPSSAAIIEATPNRWKKKKIASRKEKKEIMKRLDSGQPRDTFVKEGFGINWVKMIVVLIIALAVIGIVAILVTSIPSILNNFRKTGEDSGEKLEWLLERLEQEQTTNTAVRNILIDFESVFYPGSETYSSETEHTSPEYTSTPRPSPTPIPSPTPEPSVNDLVEKAAINIFEAEAVGRDDPAEVYRLIENARNKLRGIDGQARATSMDLNKEEVLIKAEQLMRTVVNAACFPLYREGTDKMEEGRYLEAIDILYRAYEIYPGYLDGINTYNLGKSYAGAGMAEEANEMFQFVIDNYPGTDLAGWAQARKIPIESDE